MHSRASDGHYTPAYLMELASLRGLSAVALTDHDTVDGLAEAAAAAEKFGMDFINGVELDAAHYQGTMHILGYGFDPTAQSMQGHLHAAKSARSNRNGEILRRLRELDVRIDESELLGRRGAAELGRPHIADAIVRAGRARDREAAFRDYLGEGAAAYVVGDKLKPSSCISAIRNAGGVAVLAHPTTLRCSSDLELETIVARLESDGLGGIEVWHPSQDEAKQKRLLALAKRFDLVATGGSDLHVVSSHEKHGTGFGIRIDARIVSDLSSRFGR
ncbi:MAG: PHP domain-containing protein [Phycisphaerales bacterium]|nr:PHP domain-containing protein [Phycisphaerales bacterium]MCB9858766.1 PHP domain-containing protein [Phycisphaerales bacterium]